jgi:hypothetical protein
MQDECCRMESIQCRDMVSYVDFEVRSHFEVRPHSEVRSHFEWAERESSIARASSRSTGIGLGRLGSWGGLGGL